MFLAELDEAGNQAKTYTLGNEYAGHVSELNNSLTSENKAASYYITDEQGSIRYILDQSGEVLNFYQYSAFGETIISEETTPNRLRYNAQTEDELTGLYYLRARYYAPNIGRFTQEDVIYNDGLNLYAYCNSNPVMYSDPSGFAKETCKSKVGGECGSETSYGKSSSNCTELAPYYPANNGAESGSGSTTGENARILSNNLAREGRPVGNGEAAAHIVASNGTKRQWASAADSRTLLMKYDIDINDAANGIPLGHPRPHNLTHNRAFHENVNARLHTVETDMLNNGYGKSAIRSALRRELRSIGREFENGIRN